MILQIVFILLTNAVDIICIAIVYKMNKITYALGSSSFFVSVLSNRSSHKSQEYFPAFSSLQKKEISEHLCYCTLREKNKEMN